MPEDSEHESRQLHEDVARRQYYQKSPQRIADTLSTLMARRGYAQVETAGMRQEAWLAVVGEKLAAHSRVGNIRGGLRKACEKAGVVYGRNVEGGFVFHDLRHTFNTNMRKAGVAESVIMQITGHSTREMFDRYNTVDEEDRREAIERLQGYFTCQMPKTI